MLSTKKLEREENIILFRFNTYNEFENTYNVVSYYTPSSDEANEYLKCLITAFNNNMNIELVNGAFEAGKLYKIKDISLVQNLNNVTDDDKIIPFVNVIVEEELWLNY